MLYQRGIGTHCPLFYIGWAHYYDSANAFKQAESVYNLGFQAKAQPYSELEQAHKNFRSSIAQRMLYDDSQSKKRTASHLTDQRHQITTLRTTAAPMTVPTSHMTSQMYMQAETNSEPSFNGGGVHTARPHQQPAKKFRPNEGYQQYEPHQVSQHNGHDQLEQQLEHDTARIHNNRSELNYDGVRSSSAVPSNDAIYQLSVQNGITERENTIETAGNSVPNTNYAYNDILDNEGLEPALYMLNSSIIGSDAEEDVQGTTAIPITNPKTNNISTTVDGIKLPLDFAYYSQNHHEAWAGALFLDEPDTNKVCKYPRHLVYPGGNVEYSLEEIRSWRYADLMANLRERRKHERQHAERMVEMEKERLAAQQVSSNHNTSI